MMYEVEWTDGSTDTIYVDIKNVALDKIPDEVGVGTLVLFRQGDNDPGTLQRSCSKRWHQGKITEVEKSPSGRKT